MFGTLVDWVEGGTAPDRIEAALMQGGETIRTRPLCAYPYVARYDGRGDPDDAESFDCKPNYGRWGAARGGP
jgi:feruloyl esterase